MNLQIPNQQLIQMHSLFLTSLILLSVKKNQYHIPTPSKLFLEDSFLKVYIVQSDRGDIVLIECRELPQNGQRYGSGLFRRGMTVQQQFRQAVLTFINNAAAAMDYPKVYDSELNHLNNSVLTFLANKKTPALTRKFFNDSVDTDAGLQPVTTLLPSYSFTITGFRIGQHVEYEVTLHEQYQILKRTLSNQYHFRTRYSLLEALDEKLGGEGLPAKKWFGNRSPQFVERRRVELEDYLNRAARTKKPAFYRFVAQIRNNAFNEGLSLPFSIE